MPGCPADDPAHPTGDGNPPPASDPGGCAAGRWRERIGVIPAAASGHGSRRIEGRAKPRGNGGGGPSFLRSGEVLRGRCRRRTSDSSP
jgi:hypothetical protein